MPAKRRAKVCSKPATWTVYADMLLSIWTVYAVFQTSMTPGAQEQACCYPGRRRRTGAGVVQGHAKLVLSAETTDEADACRMFDEMMIHDHERDSICMKGVHQQGLDASTDDDSPTRWWRQMRRSSTCTSTGSGSDGTVDLHALLLQRASGYGHG